MPNQRAAELVLGSVQLGLAYGAANSTGKPSRAAALALVRHAVEQGVNTFDTARAYGDSEDRLGEALATTRPVRTITKLSPLTDLPDSPSRHAVTAAVDASIAQSRAALQRATLDCVLLHRAAHMTAFDGAVWARLLDLRRDGAIKSLGVSLQSPEEALAVLASPDVAHIQLAFNLLDWRWRDGGAIEAIRARRDVTVHARSIFLQGLLASDDPKIWPRIAGVDPAALIAHIAQRARDLGRESAADLCLAYVRGQDWIDGTVIGMETRSQLDANLRLAIKPPLSADICTLIEQMIPRVPARLLDPAQWPR
ncbi:MAG TPA: aldo/keto reductase [Rhizomicrobium sp.]|nr:aldo/keto reductase [Rhizomicrobium sp.]